MTHEVVRRRVSITVGQRLFLGLLPSLLAVVLVVGLAYHGRYARQAPALVVVGAAALALLSLAMTWHSTRYLARRIAPIASAGTFAAAKQGRERGEVDEVHRIEHVVGRLGDALTTSEAPRASTGAAAVARLREHATMLSATVRSAIGQLDEVRLPLHILLEAKFGELNENQEELLGTARDAADAMDVALRLLGQIADADRGTLPVQRELVQVNDVVRAVLPLVHAAAERRGARVEVELEPGLPRVMVDRLRLAEALTLLCEAAAESVDVAHPLTVSTARKEQQVVVRLSPGPPSVTLAGAAVGNLAGDAGADHASSARNVALGFRLVEVQGGSIEDATEAISLRFP